MFWYATIFVAAPAAIVCAQAPAGTGASEAVESGPVESGESQDEAEAEQRPPSEGEPAPIPARPAGVPAAEAPKAVDEQGEDDEEDRQDTVFSGGPAPAGLGSMRSFPGVFGGAAPAGREAGHTLDLSASLSGVRAKSDTPELVEGNDLLAGSTTYGGGSVGLQYNHNWTEASVGASGSGSLAYMPSYEERGAEPWIDRWSAGAYAGISRQLGSRMRVSGNADVGYSPYFRDDLLSEVFAPTIGQPIVDTPGLDFVLARQPIVRSTVNGNLSYNTGQRTSISGYYSLARGDSVGGDSFGYNSQTFGGRYSYRLNPSLGIRAGYGYRTARFSGEETDPIGSHELDIGADGGYGRSFSLSRRTTFSFQTGSSVFLRERLDEGPTDGDGTDNQAGARTHFIVNGSAGLVHAWGRTWSANVGATRAINYEIGFSQPFLSNTAYAALGGLLTPRLDFTTSAAYTTGSVGFGSGNNGFANSYATAALRLALTEWLAGSAQYFYYHREFESGVSVPGFLPRGRDRQGVSVGLTTSFRLVGSRGRP